MKWVIMDYQNGNRAIMSAEQYEKEVGNLNEYDEAIKGIVELPVKPAWDMLTVDPETREYVLRDFGTVAHDGKTLILTEQAYMDNYGTNGAVRYYAHAVDYDGNIYRIAWDTTAAWDDECEKAKNGEYSGYLDDESNACDWDNPAEIELV